MAFKTTRSSRRLINRRPEGQQEGKPFFSKSSAGAQAKQGQAQSGQAFFQPKLTIGQPNDKYEQEADAVADSVVNKSSQQPAIQQKEISSIQRTSLSTPLEDEKLGTAEERMKRDKLIQEKPEIQKMEGEEEEALQMKSDGASANTASTQVSQKINSKAGNGQKLSPKVKAEMESGFGTDFSQVNVHTDTDAVQMNKELGAQAFTHGNDVFFNAGKYNAESSSGKRLLAHELTHVVQQKGGNSKIQRSCSPAELRALNTEMHSYCDQKRKCNMQTDTCSTANAKIAAGNGCISLRTLIQQRCFKPGDPGYHTHMIQIAQAYAAQRNCDAVAKVKCKDKEPNPDPLPVPEKVPEKKRDTVKERRRIIRESPIPAWAKYVLYGIVAALTIAAIIAVIACFASGACEIAIIVGGLSTAAAAAVILLLDKAGITDSSPDSA